jgi:HD-like signal output (HDOD) protein/ActR/RegA family two-component response regulator
MNRVLFVDDDPRLLAGLGNAFRRLRSEWRCRFALGGAEALRLMAEEPADMIVSDARMPEIEGPELLRRVQREWPTTVRIVLSGQTDSESARQLVNVAHVFLNKPCDADTIATVLRHVVAIRGVLPSPDLQALIGAVGHLPVQHRTCEKLNALLADSKVSVQRVTEAVENAPAVAAKVLQMVNSSFFGPPRQVTTLAHAVKILGIETVRAIVASLVPFEDVLGRSAAHGFSLDRGRIRSVMASRLARWIAPDASTANAAAPLALLHNVGITVLSTQLPERLADAIDHARDARISLSAAEQRVFGANHAAIGAYLLGLWGFSLEAVDAIATHHEIMEPGLQPETLRLKHVLRITAALTDAIHPPSELSPLPIPVAEWWPDAAENDTRQAALAGWQRHAHRIFAELQESFHVAAR